MSESRLSLLYQTPERHPTVRADVAALFGKYLPRHGVAVRLVTQAAQPGPIAPWSGDHTAVLPVTGRLARDTAAILWHRLRCLVTTPRSAVDAVIIRDMPTFAAVAWLVCRLRGIPFIYWMSFPIIEGYGFLADAGPRRIGWARWFYARLRAFTGGLLLYRWVLPRARHVFVQSEAMRQAMLAKGCRPGRTTAVPMGVDLEELASDEGTSADEPRLAGREALIYVGTLSASRRLDVLLEGFALAWRQRPQAMLVMVGREDVPGETDALLQLAQRLGVADQILWAGWMPRPQAAALVRASRIGLSMVPRGPLFDVSSPTKLCEYLAMGVPGLVNDIPDQAEVAHASGAAAVVPMTPQDIADGILGMLADPQRLARMGAQGPGYVRAERSYDVLATRLAQTLRQAVEGTRDALHTGPVVDS
ncbi:MAG: glycosyltransferase [Aquabacterium sp.]